jgi:HSP20 family protein
MEYNLTLTEYSSFKIKKHMNPYVCYPNSGTMTRRPVTRFVNPYFPQFTKENVSNDRTANRPAANIIRNEGGYLIQLAVPGMSKDQIKIEIENDQLIISGPQKNDAETTKFIRREFNLTGFKRTFKLHTNANSGAMTASFNQGVLSIEIPDASPETIKINIQ